MTTASRSVPPQSSGVSGPAYATAQPRTDPIPAASSAGPIRKDLREAWEAYSGVGFRAPLMPLSGQPDLNVLSNRCGPIVRRGVDFLFGPVLKMTTKAGDDAQAILDAAWGDDDKRMTTLSKLRINGGVYGHCFLKIVTPKNKTAMSADNPPRLVVQNPELYTVVTDPDDCDLVICYRCTWQEGDIWHQQRTERVDPDDPDLSEGNNYNDPVRSEMDPDVHWEITNWVKKGDSGSPDDWQQDGPMMLWPYPFAPIMDWQNYPNPNDHWGARDIDESIVSLNRALHLVESNTNSVQFSHGHPWLFATGADTGGITPTPGAITDLGSAEAKITAVSATGDTAHMMQFAEVIRSNMDEESSNPGVASGRMAELPRGAISGITIRLLYGPRIMRTEHERRLYGQGIRSVCRAVLILCGAETAAADEIDLTWQDALPQDDLAMAQMALALQQLGLSDHTIYALIGQNYDVEQEYKKQEAQDQMSAMLKGQAMPGSGPMPAPQPDSGQADVNGGQQPGDGGQQPPINHPAAIAARATMSAAMKGK